MRIEGAIKTWNDDRGFGFIAPRHGGQEIFVHIKAFSTRTGRPEIGQPVTFEVETIDGKKRAKLVEVVKSGRYNIRKPNNSPAQWGTVSYFVIPAFFAAFALTDFLWKVPGWVGGLYLGASVVCFMVYAADKSAAVGNRRRISEDTLLALGLLGGWPGAIIAQQILRHKSNKAAFRAKFWATVIVNVLGFIVLISPLRAALLA